MEANFYKANCSHYTNSLASLCMCDLSQLVHRMRMHHQMDEKQIEQLFDACEHTANNKNLIRASHRRVAVQKGDGTRPDETSKRADIRITPVLMYLKY